MVTLVAVDILTASDVETGIVRRDWGIEWTMQRLLQKGRGGKGGEGSGRGRCGIIAYRVSRSTYFFWLRGRGGGAAEWECKQGELDGRHNYWMMSRFTG